MKKSKYTKVFMAQLMLTAAWGTSVQALEETDSKDTPMEMEEVVVRVQKRAENLQDVPIAINVVNSQQLEASGIRDMMQLNVLIPGLNIGAHAGAFLPSLRGISTSINIVENPVALYIDGVYMPAQREGLRDLADVEQIAVLKGPQGTLFGRNATAGVIQITTKAPSHEVEGSVTAGYDNYGTFRGSAYITGGLTEKLAASFSASYTTQGEGYGRSLSKGFDIYKLRHSLAMRAKFLFEPGDDTQITLIGDYLNREDSGMTYQPYPGTTFSYAGFGATDSPYDTYAGDEGYNKFDGGGVSLEIDHDFGFARLVSISSYRHGGGGFRFDFDNVESPFILSTAEQINEDYTQEVQLISPDENRLRWVAGVFYIHNRQEYTDFPRVVTGFAPLAAVDRIDGAAAEKTNSYAPFVQIDYDLTDDTTVTLGARYTYEKRTIEGGNILTLNVNGGTVIPQPAFTPNELTVKKPTWRFAVNHVFTDEVSAYVSYNRGIKSGGFNIATPQSAPYLQETLDAFEAGVKSQFADGRVTLNIGGFLYKYKNLQVLTFIDGPTPSVTNGAKAELYGLDVDFMAHLSDELTLRGGFEYLHSEFTEYARAPISSPNLVNGGAIVVEGSATGNRLPKAQELVVTLALDYATTIGDYNANFNVTGSYNGDYYLEADNFLRQPAYFLMNASVRLSDADDRMSLTFAVNNIFDEAILTSYNTQAYAYMAHYGQAPRVFSITAGMSF